MIIMMTMTINSRKSLKHNDKRHSCTKQMRKDAAATSSMIPSKEIKDHRHCQGEKIQLYHLIITLVKNIIVIMNQHHHHYSVLFETMKM